MKSNLPTNCFRARHLWLTAAAILFAGPSARADFIFSPAQPAFVTAAAGSTGNSFEVDYTNNTGSTVNIGGFSFEIITPLPPSTPTTNITFTGAFNTTHVPYIFGANGLSSLFGNEIDTSTGTTLIASDVLLAGGSVAVANGATVGLGKVLFNVAPGTPAGPYFVAFTSSNAGTSLSDANGGPLATGSISATAEIMVTQSSTATPEPSTLVSGVVGGGLMLLTAWRRMRHAGRKGWGGTGSGRGTI